MRTNLYHPLFETINLENARIEYSPYFRMLRAYKEENILKQNETSQNIYDKMNEIIETMEIDTVYMEGFDYYAIFQISYKDIDTLEFFDLNDNLEVKLSSNDIFCLEEKYGKNGEKYFIDSLRKNEYGHIELENIKIFYRLSKFGNYIEITKNEKVDNSKEISQDTYDKINLILKELEIESIYFNGMKDQIDISKINFENVGRIGFENYEGIFDSKKINAKNIGAISITSSNQATFDFSNFNNQIKSYQFTNSTIKNIKSFSNSISKDVEKSYNPYIYWEEDRNVNRELSTLLKCLAKNNIAIENFTVCEWNNAGDNALIKEDFDLLGGLNVRSLYMEVDGIGNPLNLEMNLNENINGLYVDVYSNHEDYSYGELGTIKINSTNKDLNCGFDYGNITKNTHFSFPDNARISLELLDCTSIQAFYDLKNVSYLHFIEDIGPGPGADNRGEIRYERGTEETEWYDAMNGIYLPLYADYNQVLKDLEYYFKLKQLKQKLNVSPREQEEYYNEASIGDYIQLENGKMGCISSITLVKDEDVIVVDNMKDYEEFTSIGFAEKGYYTVRNSSDILYNGQFVEEEDLKLIFTPFK